MKQTIHLLLCLALSALLFNKQVQAQGIVPPWGTGTPPAWTTTEEGIMGKMTTPRNTSFNEISAAAEIFLAATPEAGEEDEDNEFATKFYRWKNFWEKQVGPDGNMNTLQQALQEIANNTDHVCNQGGQWTQSGPVVSRQNSGMVLSVYSPPNQPQIIYAGSATAGLWKTEDGGNNWTCKTDGLRMPLLGVLCIIGHPTNPNEIMISTGNTTGFSQNVGIGLLKTTDDGVTWYQVNTNYLISEPLGTTTPVSHDAFYGSSGRKIVRDPDNQNIMFTMMEHGVYKSIDSGENWDQVYYVQDEKIWDMKIILGNSNIIVFSTAEHQQQAQYQDGNLVNNITVTDGMVTVSPVGAKVAKLYVSTTGGGLGTWSVCDANLTGSDLITSLGSYYYLATTPATPNMLYIAYTHTTYTGDGTDYLYSSASNKLLKLDFSTANYPTANLSSSSGGINNFDVYNRIFEIIPTDAQKMWIGGLRLHESTNGGTTFTQVTAPSGNNYYHDDTRALQVNTDGNTNTLILGTDGGVSRGIVEQGTTDWKNINDANGSGLNDFDGLNSLLITQFYDIAIRPERSANMSNQAVLAGGTQDNTYFRLDKDGNWLHIGNDDENTTIQGDGGQTIISWANPNIVYSRGNANIHKSTDGGNNFSFAANFTVGGSYDDPTMVQDPKDPTIIHAAKASQYRKLKDNGGTALQTLSSVELNIAGAGGIAVAPSDNLQIWIGVDNGLKHSVDGGMSFSSTPNPNLNYQPNTIVINPEDANNLYIGFNGHDKDANGNGTNRVYQSFDGGLNWYDMSAGLPYLPVLDLVYQQGSNGILYAATDIGVYRYDPPTQHWACYNSGLPVCMVTDIEIDYCRQVLQIGTFGRGVWESPLQIATTPRTIIANQNTIWEQNSYCLNDIIIESGSTLTIRGTLKMGADKKIVVQRGAKLIVDGGTITNTCGDRWGGIEVWGNATVQHKDLFGVDTPDALTVIDYENLVLGDGDPGMVVLKNDATLENSNINTLLTDRSGGYYPSYYGGIVYAENSTFSNCRKSATFMKYDPLNFSQFKGCTFEGNDTNIPFEGISIWDCKGIAVDNCLFTFAGTATNTRMGITAGEGLRVTNCHFTNLKKAISLGASSYTTGNSVVNNNTFTNNEVAITDMGLNYLHAETNQITGGIYGILLGSNSQHYLHNNTFNGQTAAIFAIGTSQNTIGDNNIDCNTFTNNQYGVFTYGNNSGLQFYDNTFTTTNKDVIVSGNGSSINGFQGILSPQGDFLPFYNLFTLNRPTHRIATAGNNNPFFYFYHTDPLYTTEVNDRLVPHCYLGETPPFPGCTTTYNYSAIYVTIPFGITYSGCLDLNGDGFEGDLPPNIEDCQTKECYYAMKAYLLSLENTKDSGDKQALLNDLYNSPEALATYQKYIAASPYLTDEVLKEVAQSELLSPSRKTNILISNAPLSDAMMNIAYQNVSASVYQVLYAIKYYVKMSARDNLDMRIGTYTDKKETLLRQLLGKFADEKDYAQLDELLTVENTTYAVRVLLNSKIAREQFADAQAMLDYLPATNTDEQDYKTIQQINLERVQATTQGFELSEAQYQALHSIAIAYGTQAPYAQTLLGILRGETFDWQLPLESGKTDAIPYPNAELSELKALNTLVVQPNPAQQAAQVWIPAYSLEQAAELQVFDVTGKLMQNIGIETGSSLSTIDVSNLANGIYLISLTADGVRLGQAKMIVQHQ